MDLEALITVQETFPYFEMLNGPTYVTLVKDFWIRAEVYDVEAALDEEDKAMIRNPSLRGKTRQEIGMELFIQTEIRSTVMGIPITITEEVIAKACRVALDVKLYICGSKRRFRNQAGEYRQQPQDASEILNRMLSSEWRRV